jgi:hypothetical protein
MKQFWKQLMAALGVLLILGGVLPQQASAYSYGDPNEEAVAEVYKKMVAKLNEDPPNFAGAKEIFDPIKQELDMHMGADASEAVHKALDAKNKELVILDMQKILVLNIARRMESIEKDFQNYKNTKMLIAKANATYEALSPAVKQKNPGLDTELRAEFEKALQSLGNPGLFGVGVKEPEPQVFKASKDKILTSLQKQFNLKSLEVGHFTEGPGPGNEQNARKRVGTDFSDIKNWIPIAVIVGALTGIILFTRKKARK